MNHINHVLFLVLKTCQTPNPGGICPMGHILCRQISPYEIKKLDIISAFKP